MRLEHIVGIWLLFVLVSVNVGQLLHSNTVAVFGLALPFFASVLYLARHYARMLLIRLRNLR